MYRDVHFKLFTRSVDLKINIQSNEYHYDILDLWGEAGLFKSGINFYLQI